MKRIKHLDIAKLIGLALVCFCHIPPTEGNFHVWVYSFHMPLFFIISGMFFNTQKTSVIAATRQLLIPFLAFNAIVLLFNSCLNSVLNHNIVFPEVNLKSWMIGKYEIGPSWFLLSLFYIRVFCGTLYQYLKIQGITIVSFLFLLVFYLTNDFAFWNILNFGSTILGLPFYILGYIFRDFILKIINYRGGVHISNYHNVYISIVNF